MQRRRGVFSTSFRRLVTAAVIDGSSNPVGTRQSDSIGEPSMAAREAARPSRAKRVGLRKTSSERRRKGETKLVV